MFTISLVIAYYGKIVLTLCHFLDTTHLLFMAPSLLYNRMLTELCEIVECFWTYSVGSIELNLFSGLSVFEIVKRGKRTQ